MTQIFVSRGSTGVLGKVILGFMVWVACGKKSLALRAEILFLGNLLFGNISKWVPKLFPENNISKRSAKEISGKAAKISRIATRYNSFLLPVGKKSYAL